jgi:NADH-quinone oxidoreductase subunit L
MLVLVSFLSLLIAIYSIGYMAHEGGYSRFFAYMNLFMGMMLTLTLASNLLVMFVGWEGVGLCSYLLIGFWYEDPEKAYAGLKAFVVNRIGDFGFLLGIFSRTRGATFLDATEEMNWLG